jgi:hypothetical protein
VEKAKKSREELLELLVVIMLGVTAILTAWASWIGSVHGANQAGNYALSSVLSAEGNSEYNAGVQFLMQDMLLYNEVMNLLIDQYFAEERDDFNAYESIDWKLDQLITHMSDDLLEAHEWAMEQSELLGENITPFMNEEFMASYFAVANEFLTEADAALQQGDEDNANSDKFGLVAVIYTVALFMLGITSTFKDVKNKTIVFIISISAILVATIYLLFLPMPTDFNLFSFFTRD